MRSRKKEANAVAEPWVDMSEDIAAVNRGEGERLARDTWRINGRTYRGKADGATYPIEGPGIHFLNRGEYRALAIYNDFGLSPLAETQLDREMIDTQARRGAPRVWQRIQITDVD